MDGLTSISNTSSAAEIQNYEKAKQVIADAKMSEALFAMGSIVGDQLDITSADEDIFNEEETFVEKEISKQEKTKQEKKAEEQQTQIKENIEQRILEQVKVEAETEAKKVRGEDKSDYEGLTEEQIAEKMAEERLEKVQEHQEIYGLNDISWLTI